MKQQLKCFIAEDLRATGVRKAERDWFTGLVMRVLFPF